MNFKGMKNIYLCSGCGRGVVTQDMDAGVTPFIIFCDRPGCGKPMQSLCYKVPQRVLEHFPATFEWYAPAGEEIAGLAPQVREHVQKGGLVMRQVTA